MVTLLEFLFQGFFEWVYGLILEIWNYFSSSLLNVMSLDFAYIKSHIPIMGDIQQVILAVGWALLLGNLVFQALRSMVSGLGFEGEDPKLLFARTFVFGFLLLASPQICETVLGITSSVIALLEVPDAINVQLVDGSVIGVFTASWILVIIFDLITMFMVLSLLLEVAERYMVLAMLTVMAPLAFAMGGSKSTSEIFAGWCRMFGSMCFLMATNIVFFKMLLSVVSTVPSFPDVFLWMVLIISIVKVAKKADEIITRIGLNPAITGNRSTLPGVIAYTVFRTALSMVTKGAANGVGGALGLTGKAAAGAGKGAADFGKKAAGTAFKGAGRAVGAAGAAVGGVAGGIGGAAAGQRSDRPRYGGGRTQTQQANNQQEHTRQDQRFQQTTAQTQTGGQQQNTTQERTAGGRTAGPQTTSRPGASSRRSSVPQGTRRAPSYVTPPSGQAKTEEKSTARRESPGSATDTSGGFTGFHGPPSRGGGFTKETARGGGFSGGSRGGGFTKETARGGGFNGGSRGGGFSKETARGGGFSDKNTTATQESTSRSTFGDRGGGFGRRADTDTTGRTFGSRGGGFGKTTSQTSHKTEISQSGSAGTGKPPATKMSAPGVSSPQSGTAGTGPRSTQRPAVPEPRPGRNVPPSSSAPAPGTQRPSPTQQEQRQSAATGKPSVKGGGSVSHPGTAGTRTPPATKLSGSDAPGSQSGTAGTAPGSRTPPGQKLGGGPSKQKPMRQTKRKEGPTSV